MHIRPVTVNDTEQILNIYRHYILHTTITLEEQVPSLAEFQKRIETISVQYPYIVSEEDGRITGFAYAANFRSRSAYRWLVEVAIYVDNHAQGRGSGRKLLSELLGILTKLGYYDAYAVVTLPNERSVALFELFGFEKNTILKQAGYKHGRWIDAGVWVKNLRKRNDAPSEPKLFSEISSK